MRIRRSSRQSLPPAWHNESASPARKLQAAPHTPPRQSTTQPPPHAPSHQRTRYTQLLRTAPAPTPPCSTARSSSAPGHPPPAASAYKNPPPLSTKAS